MKRRCGWLGFNVESIPQPIWTRREIFTTCCPKPLITPQSIAWIEAYVVFKRLGGGLALSTPAKDVDAFLILEDLVFKERADIGAVARSHDMSGKR